ncbi:hypothetical protein BsWGS_00952 [Bradybaena similaris]
MASSFRHSQHTKHHPWASNIVNTPNIIPGHQTSNTINTSNIIPGHQTLNIKHHPWASNIKQSTHQTSYTVNTSNIIPGHQTQSTHQTSYLGIKHKTPSLGMLQVALKSGFSKKRNKRGLS